MNAKVRIPALLGSLSLSLLLAACGTGPTPNLHPVDRHVWRSGQPDRQDFRELEKAGIHQVLTLRRWHSDEELAPGLTRYRIPMEAGELDDQKMLQALSILAHSKQPILVHCWHGSDRTGAVVALYRMVVQHWPREKAIAELMTPEYGHHSETFPNIRHYLETVDIARMRQRLATTPPPPPERSPALPRQTPAPSSVSPS